MGNQKGIVRLSGQFGDMLLTIDGKKGGAQLSTGVSKARLKSAPEFDKTRKVNKEFEAASLGADMLQDCVCGKNTTFGDRYLRSRMQGVMISAVRRGPGSFGQRSLEVLNNVVRLKDFPLNKEDRFKNWFGARYDVQVNPDRNTGTMTVPPFLINSGTLRVPQGATHFRVFLCVGVLGDLVYSASDARYEAVDPQLIGLNDEATTPWMLAELQNPGFQLVASLPNFPVLPLTAGLVVSLGVEFCFMVNNNPEVKAVGNAMDVLGVF